MDPVFGSGIFVNKSVKSFFIKKVCRGLIFQLREIIYPKEYSSCNVIDFKIIFCTSY